MAEQYFSINCYQPLPPSMPYDLETLRTDGVNLWPRVTALEWSTGIPGGYLGAKVGLMPEFSGDRGDHRAAWLQRAVTLPALGHVVIRTGQGGEVFAGRRARATYVGSKVSGFELVGYGSTPMADMLLTNQPQITTSGQNALRWALNSASPPYKVGDALSFEDPGIPHNLIELNGKTVSQVVDEFSKVGGQQNVLFDMTVYDRRQAFFLPRVAPTTPDYLIPIDNTVTITDDDEQLYSSVRLTYTDFTSKAAQTVTASVQGLSFSRTKQLPGGIMTRVAAAQYARTWVNLHALPWTSIKVTRDKTRGLEIFSGGAQRPSFYARAGEWAQVGDQGAFVIVRSQYVAHTGQLSLDLGQPEGGWPQLLSNLRSTALSVSRGTNPNTSALVA